MSHFLNLLDQMVIDPFLVLNRQLHKKRTSSLAILRGA